MERAATDIQERSEIMFRTNKNKQSLAVVAAMLITVMMPVMASINTDRHDNKAPKDSLSYNDRRRYDYFFTEAVRQKNAGRHASAFDLLNHCIEINPYGAEAYYARAMYYSQLDNDSMALADLERAAAINPDNDTYHERVAQYYIGTKDYDKAITTYETLYEHHRDRSDVLNILAQLYRQKKDFNKMLRSVERIEEIEGPSDDITMAKMNIYEMKGDKEKACEMLRSLVDIHPYDAIYKVMLGNWLLQNGQKEESLEMFTKALENDPDNESALSSMYDYYRSAGLDSMANNLRENILTSRKASSRSKLAMLRQLIGENESNNGDSTAVLGTFDRVMAIDSKDVDIAILKASYMEMKGMQEDSVYNAYARALDISPDHAGVRLRMIQSQWEKERWNDVIDLCKPATQYNPDEMAFYYYMGLAHFQKNEEDEALDAFKRGVGEINEESNPEIVSDFYAIMGDILFKKNRPEEAFAAYDSCLQWKADHISCLNNYAYYLSELDRDLSKAEQMSYKTVQAEPNNVTYIDTYAWILFMQQRYNDAKAYIDRALEIDTAGTAGTAGPVIIEHAGDIYAMCGNMDKAVEMWQKAIAEGGDKALIGKKIKQRKYIRKETKTRRAK